MHTDSPLSVEAVHKKYGKHTVLDNVSLQLNKGEIFGLIGLNGVGKTTLIKIILHLSDSDRGVVSIFGKSSGVMRWERSTS